MSARFNQRLGFHYYPDTLHYRQSDLEACLPILQGMGAAWVTLLAPAGRAIPEYFLDGLLAAGIQPVLHFTDLRPGMPPSAGELQPLLRSYARWGVRYVTFYDRPNLRERWAASLWAQSDLVERFLDGYLPLAGLAFSEGLAPVFPPLEPGGDYWDLAFLRSALHSLHRRAAPTVLENLVLSAYAWTGERPLDWGAGGPRRWPDLLPYQVQPDMQDQRGFRIFDWYLAVAQEELGIYPPVLLLRAGYRLNAHRPAGSLPGVPLSERLRQARLNLTIARNLAGEVDQPAKLPSPGDTPPGSELLYAEPLPALPPVPPEVLACSFWLLAADPAHPAAAEAWIDPAGHPLPVVEAFRQWADYQVRHPQVSPPPEAAVLTDLHTDIPLQDSGAGQGGLLAELQWALQEEPETGTDWPGLERPAVDVVPQPARQASESMPRPRRPISHYILLPLYAWGAANWDLTLVEPLLQDSHPTIGFSLAEASLAERVTVIAGEGAISADALEWLRQSGCQVERIMDDGTFVATGAVYPWVNLEENNL